MLLLSAKGVSRSIGTRVVLDGLDASLSDGDRIAIIGPNGCGKTTLARILSREDLPDGGEVVVRGGIKLELLGQNPTFEPEATVIDTVRSGLRDWSAAKNRFDAVTAEIEAGNHTDLILEAQAEAQREVEAYGGWNIEHRIRDALAGLSLTDKADRRVSEMSGGEQRRTALARTLVRDAELTILDEPTNHLDIGAMEWLETYIRERMHGAVLLITHDRYFLDQVVDQTWEMSNGAIFVHEGGWANYLEDRATRLELEQRDAQVRAGILRKELDWVRRQPSARQTKQKARTDRYHELAKEDAAAKQQGFSLNFEATGVRTGKLIVETQNLSVDQGGRRLVQGLDFILQPGERVGIVGPNGAGKTTLLRALLGEHPSSEGFAKLATNTKIAYFDQRRTTLEPEKTIWDNIAEKQSRVTVGTYTMDIRTYVQRFGIDPSRIDQPVGSLSGGEGARVALAKLLLRPANLFVFDEPTNDLDVDTLSALEDLLIASGAAALIVTHDRYFLDRVATSILSFEGDGKLVRYEGNYTNFSELRATRKAALAASEKAAEKAAEKSVADKAAASIAPTKAGKSEAPKKKALTYGERIELEKLPLQIETHEERLSTLEALLNDPEAHRTRGAEIPGLTAKLEALMTERARLYARWEELEGKNS